METILTEDHIKFSVWNLDSWKLKAKNILFLDHNKAHLTGDVFSGWLDNNITRNLAINSCLLLPHDPDTWWSSHNVTAHAHGLFQTNIKVTESK